MATPRFSHSATALADGSVLIAGGVNQYSRTPNAAEIYHPSTGTFTATGSMFQGRAEAASARMADGRVLIAAGYAYCPGVNPLPSDQPCIDAALATAEIFDPTTGKFAKAGAMADARGAASLQLPGALLTDGRVLVEGGVLHSGDTLGTSALYDPVTGTWVAAGPLKTARGGHTATRLPNGRVLIAGGFSLESGTNLKIAELYVP